MSISITPSELAPDSQEAYKLGEIIARQAVDPYSLGIPAELHPRSIETVKVADPYVEHYKPDEIIRVKSEELQADTFARERREQGAWKREPQTAYFDAEGKPQNKRSWGDPASRTAFFGQLGSPAIDAWRTNIPSAKALMYLSDPESNETVVARNGRTIAPMDDTGRMWLSLCTDAVGIRSRATVMSEVVKEFTETREDKDVRWLSVACGTALPTMKAAIHANVQPELLLADLDEDALESTAKLAKEIGFTGEIAFAGEIGATEETARHTVDIFNKEEMQTLGARLDENGGRPHMIDLMGIFEYTGENLGVDPVEFLKTNYELLAPGGRLIFGQMRADRPVADFTMGVVSWPYVEMRDPAEFLAVIRQAGLPLENTSLLLPEDGVYTVGVIDKPAE